MRPGGGARALHPELQAEAFRGGLVANGGGVRDTGSSASLALGPFLRELDARLQQLDADELRRRYRGFRFLPQAGPVSRATERRGSFVA